MVFRIFFFIISCINEISKIYSVRWKISLYVERSISGILGAVHANVLDGGPINIVNFGCVDGVGREDTIAIRKLTYGTIACRIVVVSLKIHTDEDIVQALFGRALP